MSSTVDKVKAKAMEVVQEDGARARDFVFSAANSGSYIYPIKGIFYFISHRALWKPLLKKLVPTLSLSVAVVTFMFVFAYLPQFAVLVWVNGPLAAFSTALLTLSESSTIINIISKNFFLQEALVDTFDGTLLARNEAGVVSGGREVKSGSDPINKLGKLLKSPFEKYSPKALIRYLMYLPLNFIPVVGTVVFIALQGRTRGQSAHTRYFQLKKWSASTREQYLKENVGPYTAFGTVATLLELVPFAGIFFTFTNTVGASLWAADMEKSQSSGRSDTTAPSLREAAKKAA